MKAVDCVDQQTVENSTKDENTRLPYLSSEKPEGKEATEPDMEQLTDTKLGKEHVKAAYCYSAYLTFMQSTSWEMPV